jgi:hypothetical protein
MGRAEWKKGALTALAPAGLALGYLAWRNGGTLPSSARFWALLLLVIGPEIAGALAGEYLQRTGRGLAGRLVALGGMVWLLGGCALLAAKTDAATLTDAERAPFVSVDDGGERRLRHPTLGFSVLDPGRGFTAERAQAIGPESQFYSFVNPGGAERLVIWLFKGQGDSTSSLRKLLETVSRQSDVLGGDAKVPVRVVELQTSPVEPPRGVLRIALDDGRQFRTTAYGWRAADGTSFAILVAVMARAPDAAADVLASFRP